MRNSSLVYVTTQCNESVHRWQSINEHAHAVKCEAGASKTKPWVISQGLQVVLLRMIPQYQDIRTAAAGNKPGKGPRTYDIFGSPSLQPPTYDLTSLVELQLPLFQATLLTAIRLEDMQQHPELAAAAYASCMKWFLGTITAAMRLQRFCIPSFSGDVMTPYLQLIRKSRCRLSTSVHVKVTLCSLHS